MILNKHPRRIASAGAALLLWAAATTHLLAGTPGSAGPVVTVIKDFMFTPTTIAIKSGTTVTWNNKDDEPHTIVSDSGLFRSGGVDTDESFSFKFDKPGTYHYTCSIHPRMVGTIVVE